MESIKDDLQELRIEDFIWIIYAFIVIAALVSNALERAFLVSKRPQLRRKFKTINITIFFVTFIIYFYFVLLSFRKLKNAQRCGSVKEIFLNHANYLAACFFLVGGCIYLFTEISSNSFDTSPSQII